MYACPLRGGCGTCSFGRGRGPDWCICPVCRVSDCGYEGRPSRGPGFVYHVGGYGSCCRHPSLLEKCCRGCACRAGYPLAVDLIQWRASTRVSSTSIGLWPATDRRGCCRCCWTHGAWLVSMLCYLKLLVGQGHPPRNRNKKNG